MCDGKENLWRDPAAHFCLGIDLTVASRTKYGRAGPLSVSPARADRTDMFSTHPSHVQLFTSFMKSNRAAAATIVRNSRLSVNCCSLSFSSLFRVFLGSIQKSKENLLAAPNGPMPIDYIWSPSAKAQRRALKCESQKKKKKKKLDW